VGDRSDLNSVFFFLLLLFFDFLKFSLEKLKKKMVLF